MVGVDTVEPKLIPGLVNIQKTTLKMAIVRVDLPMKNWWIFHSYVSLPEGNFVMMPNGAYSPSMLHLVTGRQTVQSKVVPHGNANVERGPLQMANTG